MRNELTSISIFLPNLAGGGAERMMLNLAEGFIAQGIQVDFIVAKREGAYKDQYEGKIRFIDLNASRVLWAIPKLMAYLKKKRPSVFLTTLDHANVAALLAKRLSRVPTSIVIREANTLSSVTGHTGSMKEKLLPFLIKRLYKHADGIISVSAGVAQDLASHAGIPLEKIHVIYNPVVNADLLEKAEEHNDHPWLREGEPPVLLAAGRLTKQKDFPTLVKAFAMLRAEAQARLIILGEGEERQTLEKLCVELGVREDVDLPGFVQNPFSYMSRASAFVLSSTWEGLPGALIQAMACGCTVVSTDCPSGPDEILNGGTFGILVPPGDAGSLAAGMAEALRNPFPSSLLKERAAAFSAGTITEQYADLLVHVSSKGSGLQRTTV
ncbi:glycosyltransferase [Brevibacillus fluminis]|uniref:glycosyltransferase n=1 Tax=Brevibacillus fluminis TaxID=511487 RepID=UPI003F8A9C18